ncbi:MAG: 6-phosphogluconolactonase [Myxococcota bacterium]
MREEILPDLESVARRAARVIAKEARAAVDARGRFLLATSGGATPWRMLRILADENVPWARVHLFQVDERVAPATHPERNFTHLCDSLLVHVSVPLAGVHAMPVEQPDLALAAAGYATTLRKEAGDPPVLDLVHLGSARAVTPPRWFQTMPHSTSPIATWRRRRPIGAIGG